MTNIVKNKNGIEFDIDTIATDLNGKMDRDGNNAECPTLLSRTANSYGGVVEIWSDGYCVQTGIVNKPSTGLLTIPLTQSYANTNYTILLSQSWYGQQGNLGYVESIDSKTTSSFNIHSPNAQTTYYVYYETKGYIR